MASSEAEPPGEVAEPRGWGPSYHACLLASQPAAQPWEAARAGQLPQAARAPWEQTRPSAGSPAWCSITLHY